MPIEKRDMTSAQESFETFFYRLLAMESGNGAGIFFEYLQ